MRKLLWLVVVILIILVVGWYLISPAFEIVEVDEVSPLEIKDAMLTMDDARRAEFDKAVDDLSGEIIEMEENMDSGAALLAEGVFKERAHDVSGRALLIDDNGKRILRFENFDTINGPNLHIYLSSELGDDDFVDLGEIKATKGNVNYEISDDVDLEKYNKVLVWCVPFRVLFSYAELGEI
jgi:hypothetical protein